MRRARAAAFATTVLAWLAACVWFWQHLVEEASDSPELYTRTGGFQLLNFVWQYLWGFGLVLIVLLAVEWALFRLLERFVNLNKVSR